MTLLAQVGHILAASLDRHRALSDVGALLVPLLADFFMADVCVDDALETAAVAHVDPEITARVRQVWRPAGLPSEHPVVTALLASAARTANVVLPARMVSASITWRKSTSPSTTGTA